MCNKYTVCGKRHLPKWKMSRRLRNRKGRFDKDRRLYKYLIIGFIIYGISMLGINTIIDWAKSLEKAFLVENAKAIEIITWEDEVRSILERSGINVDFADRLIQCESTWNPEAIHYNKGSVDRGLWQINSFFHPEVSKECAFDPACSTVESIKIIKSRGWSEWSCVSKGLIK